ncbi:hypothetical protein Y032_0544g3234 [Ancylostoma ceylanicum]|uniref:BTB domain-containing protein n=2 Tax=Ancylostoma ceylanicum TaxID=53326 RepID=A0A016WQM3_9BILA|nr:hypothetical protein Y032_0544g3234 [Ancylostoma ceylanicum]
MFGFFFTGSKRPNGLTLRARVMSLQTDNFLGNFGFNFDFDACINVRSSKEGNDIDEPVLAHRLVLSSASARFRNLLAAGQQESPIAKIDIDLREIPNSINAFKAMLSGLYTGELNFALADHSEILAVARHCEVPTIESKLLAASHQEPAPFAALFSQQKFPTIAPNPPWQTYLHTLLALYMQPGLLASTFGGLMMPCQTTAPLHPPPTPPADESRASADESSSPRTTPTAYNEKIVPNDDKEGWCRNKKYIEKVDSGFMCTVCRKVYGRYNSVSYHVTIYHRNPPIRCDESGCQFSTREARYIHFHKYYRHHIPLPDSIDLGSRKCPFCRHVSKSPAMLEKHIARHVPERKEKLAENFSCDQCMYRGKTEALLDRHKQFAHSADVFPRRIRCSLCPFASSSQHALILHIASSHSPSESMQNVERTAPQVAEQLVPITEV